MATEQYQRPHRGSIQRTRSARLADQAATAALYVTQPERRLSVREPAAVETREKAIARRLSLSQASAGAALAHTQAQAQAQQAQAHARTNYDIWMTEKSSAVLYPYSTQDQVATEAPPAQPPPEVYKAAICAVRERRATTTLPPVSTGFKHQISTTPDQAYGVQRSSVDKDRALRAATGAYYSSRRRAESAPSKPTIAPFEDPYAAALLAGTQKAEPEFEEPPEDHELPIEASKIHQIATANVRRYTEQPPPSVTDYDKQKMSRAAALSMSREMYEITETKEQPEEPTIPTAAYQAAQIGHRRMSYQRAVPEPDPDALKKAIALQEVARKRADEKLAKLYEVTPQEYYGINEPQAQRPGRSIRRRRTSVDSDVSAAAADVERSREIRHQMTSLRTRLDAVDETRTRDRALLMEAAKRNVNAAMNDMDMRVYNETGRRPPSVQKDLEETARERIEQERRETGEQYMGPDTVNLGANTYMDMADVEAVARSRLQPTFDEIQDRAEKQRAAEIEARLDEEQRRRHEAIEREREQETKAEEKRLIETQKQEAKKVGEKMKEEKKQEEKEKEEKKQDEGKEKNWLWRRLSKRVSKPEAPAEMPPVQKDTQGAVVPALGAGAPVVGAGAAPELAAAAAPEVTPETHEAAFESVPEAAPEGVPPAVIETAPTVEPEVVPEFTSEVAPDTPEAEFVTVPEAAPEREPEAVTETTPTVVVPGVAPEEVPVLAPEALPAGTVPPKMKPEGEQLGGETQVVATGAVPEPRQTHKQQHQSRLKTWFKGRLGGRSNGNTVSHPRETEGKKENGTGTTFSGGAALAEEETRGAALRSHPVTGNDLAEMQHRTSADEGNLDAARTADVQAKEISEQDGDNKQSPLRPNFMKTTSRNSDDYQSATEVIEHTASNGVPATHTIEREELRESAAEQGLPVPPTVGKRSSTFSSGRESRFSENL